MNTNNVKIDIDKERKIIWLTIGSKFELHYSFNTIQDCYNAISIIAEAIQVEHIKHVVITSSNAQVWNMGGDLSFFVNCVEEKNYNLLKVYAYNCVAFVQALNNSFGVKDCVVVSVLEGNAYGGGFECALATDYIIAAHHVKCSFPEVLFGTFPGMGAYSLLTRKIGYKRTAEMINSGKKWSTSTLMEHSLIWKCVEQGQGVQTVVEAIKRNELPPKNAFEKICTSVTLEELQDIVDLWVNQVMQLDTHKLHVMKKLVNAQKKAINVVEL